MDRDYRPIDVHRKVVEFADGGRLFAVALVLKAEGSTPREAGAKAVIDENGSIWGTVGGGKVEAECQRRAIEACKAKCPVIFDFYLEGAGATDDAPICGGTMRILIDPTAVKGRPAYAQAAEALQKRERGILLTAIRSAKETDVGAQWFSEEAIPLDAAFPGTEAIRSCLAREMSQLFVEDSASPAARLEVFVEPLIPKPLLLIVGGGHIGQALAIQATLIGFDVVVMDDRPEFTNPALFPDGVATRCGDVAGEVANFPVSDDTYIVVVTRGHKHDADALRACIHSPAAYIGMIGSKRKVALIRKDFIETGIATEEEFNRVCAPIGLDIGSVTVPEIATSITAQLIAVRRKGSGCTTPGDMVQR
ncbi:MAG: XdhC family protein [bacterium]|nr:XdhC family protein [bacterium]